MSLRPAPLLPCLLLLSAACAAPPQLVPADVYRADVAWLADDARGGRDTGSPGLEEASQWVALQFEAAGLERAGTRGWLQPFEVAGSRRLVDGNSLVFGGTELSLNDQYLPLQTAVSGEAEGEVVFVGYGIHDPDGGWDDYAGVDVKGKIVLALRKGPRVDVAGTRYAENGAAWERITFASKVNTAFRQGAAALLVVNDPAHYGPDRETDLPQRYGPLGGQREGGATGASLPAASLSFTVAQALLAPRGADLAELQTKMEAAGQPCSFALDLQAKLIVRSERQTIQSANVLGWLPGSDPALAGEYVVVGAHLDHLGLGEGGPTRGEIHNGADDNASGSAGMVAIARLLAGRRDELKRSVLFAAWSAEERGLLGSEHWVRNPTRPLEGLVATLNLDMIGRSTDGYLAVEGVATSPGFGELVVAAHDALGLRLDLHLAPKPSANSDQWPFFREGTPVLAFFTGLHEDYHKPGDDAHKVNAEGGAQIASLAAEVARRLSIADTRPAFTQPVGMEERVSRNGPRPRDGQPGAAHGEPGQEPPPSSAYRVVLGTSPDMTYQKEDGVLVGGVREDTPAQRCGLQKGDLITALDGKPVRTLEDYATLLFAHKPGDEVVITILRGGDVLELTARLAGKIGEN